MSADQGQIRLEDVCFSCGDAPVLRHFSAQMRPGRIVAIVGASGSGKSTLFALLTRLHAPQQGQINAHCRILRRSLQPQSGRCVPGFLPVPSFGVCKPCPDRSEPEPDCGGLHDFIESLPQGYDTVLDEDAADLSGGQKQRLAIARALLRGAKILLCDELTSAMDEKLSAEVFNMLEEIRPGHTIVLITHKMAEQARADDVIDLGASRGRSLGTPTAFLVAEQAL